MLIQNEFSGSLRLDGDFIKLGSYKEVHNMDANTDSLLLEAVIDGHRLSWGYERDPLSEDEKDSNLLPFSESMDLGLAGSIANQVREKYKNNFNFLCAERWGPRDNYPYSNQRRSRSWLGIHGEYTAQVLTNLLESSKSLGEGDPRIHDKITSRLVIDNFTKWMGEISPDTFVKSDSITHANISTNQFVFDGHTYRATNVGFGLSYALPVVLSLVMARSGGLVIIENPEAHLHPKGQSYLGRLIQKTAEAGVQVIIETHSDHLLNGIRVAARLSENYIAGSSRVFFVSPGEDQSNVEPIDIGDKGELSNWPSGFFDQQAEDIRTLMKGVDR
ncbi:AAA family ATPase [Vibrio alginolyticus]|uniref:AAA family ATPase n=1 Tax=Vibrio alginolyticus TaxID=663 RepID=UPI002FF6FC83